MTMSAENERKSELDREIDAALEGVELQDMGMPEERGKETERGDRLYTGVVVGVSGDDVFCELGPRMQGVSSLGEFEEKPEVGQRYQFTLHGRDDDDLWILSRREARALATWEKLEVGADVKARVSGQNKGGLELNIGSHDAFMPASQVALARIEDFSPLLGETMVCRVLEIDHGRKRVVLSRRVVLEEERAAERRDTLGGIQVGSVLSGKVTRIEPFGAFVDLGGGLEGLVHVSAMSRKRVENPRDHVEEGQQVQVQVMKIEEGGKRVGLSMKALEPDPWEGVEHRFSVDSVVTGKVTRLADFGAFVEIAEGVEGLVHVSQLGKERTRRPRDVVSVGDELSVRILSIEPVQQRISLTRLDPRGALIGSEEAVDADVLNEALGRTSSDEPLSTNLGSLFKKALEGKKRPQG